MDGPIRTRLFWVGTVAAIAVVGGVLHYRSSVAFRARHYFSIPWTRRVTPDSIGEGVKRVVPLGTPADQVASRLRVVGIGTDGLSGYYPPESGCDGVIRLEYDPNRLAVVQEHYGIMLHYSSGLLSQVRVEPWFTGL